VNETRKKPGRKLARGGERREKVITTLVGGKPHSTGKSGLKKLAPGYTQPALPRGGRRTRRGDNFRRDVWKTDTTALGQGGDEGGNCLMGGGGGKDG